MMAWDPETMARTVRALNKRFDLVGFWGSKGRPRLPRSGAYSQFVDAVDARRRLLSRRNLLRKRSHNAIDLIRQLLKDPAGRRSVLSIVRQRMKERRRAS
jgi:hypothetical protein